MADFQIQVTDHVNSLEKVFFCGNVGDPCADLNLLDKISWLKRAYPHVVVGINTNGSIRNRSWWKRCGELLSGTYDYVVFSIDGLEDTNHVYRVNVQYKKIMQNAQAYIGTGASAHWDMLVFDHNKHQVEQCKQLAQDMGFTWFRSKETDRWDMHSFEHLKPANPYTPVDYTGIDSVDCERNRENSEYIDYKGQVFPCCHIGEVYYTNQPENKDMQDYTPEQLMTEYQKRLDDNQPFYICKRSCGATSGKRSQWKQEIQLR